MPVITSTFYVYSDIELTYVSWATTALAVGYAVYLTMKAPKSEEAAIKRINAKIDLGSTKVVNTCDIEDLEKKAVFCRCWKSNKVRKRLFISIT